jgi:hypothetical protein
MPTGNAVTPAPKHLDRSRSQSALITWVVGILIIVLSVAGRTYTFGTPVNAAWVVAWAIGSFVLAIIWTLACRAFVRKRRSD